MTAPAYAPELTLREARELYFRRNGFDGGYGGRWVRLQAGPVPLYFPNTAARVRAVRYHDLHHVLTEYPTTWLGEAQIGAWEIASGCGRHYPAWALNFGAFAVGLALGPSAVYAAFLRGRRTANLYHEPWSEALLDQTVGSLRERLRLTGRARAAGLRDRIGFALWAAAAVAAVLAPIPVGIAAIAWVVGRLRR